MGSLNIENLEMRFAKDTDYDFLRTYDKHIRSKQIKNKTERKEIIICEDKNKNIIGWLRYSILV